MPVAPRLAFRDLGPELALAETDAVQLGFDRGRERLRCARRFFESRSASFFVRFSASASAALAAASRIGAVLERSQLGAGFGRPREQLRVGLAPESPLGVGDPLELGLHLLQPVGLRLERVEKPPQLERRLGSAGARCPEAHPRRLRALERSRRPLPGTAPLLR